MRICDRHMGMDEIVREANRKIVIDEQHIDLCDECAMVMQAFVADPDSFIRRTPVENTSMWGTPDEQAKFALDGSPDIRPKNKAN